MGAHKESETMNKKPRFVMLAALVILLLALPSFASASGVQVTTVATGYTSFDNASNSGWVNLCLPCQGGPAKAVTGYIADQNQVCSFAAPANLNSSGAGGLTLSATAPSARCYYLSGGGSFSQTATVSISFDPQILYFSSTTATLLKGTASSAYPSVTLDQIWRADAATATGTICMGATCYSFTDTGAAYSYGTIQYP